MIDLDSINEVNPHKEVNFDVNLDRKVLDKIVKILYTTQSIDDIAKVVLDEEGYEHWLEDRWK